MGDASHQRHLTFSSMSGNIGGGVPAPGRSIFAELVNLPQREAHELCGPKPVEES
jgi:hypothetical protein